MIFSRRLFLSLLVAIVAAGCAGKPHGKPTVVWISIDGFRPDYLDRASAPTLNRLVREGASTRRLIPPTPSLTFPSHVTQATGVPPGAHGIPANSFYDTATKTRSSFPNESTMLQAEPIWLTATRQGVRTLVCDWPLSYAPGEKFEPDLTDQQRLDRLLQRWREDPPGEFGPIRLVMGYVKNIDVVGHKHGPDSPEVRAAVERLDAQLARFISDATTVSRAKSPRDDVYFVFTSDHGMATARTMVNFEKLFDRPPPRSVRRITGGTFAMLYLDEVPQSERDAMRSSLLADLRRHRFLDVYTRDKLPKEWGLAHPTRVGDIVIFLQPGYLFSERLPLVTFPVERVGSPGGAHGYIPAECPDMNALCLIWRSPTPMKRRDLGRVGAAQMHATVASLLGIKSARGAAPAAATD